MPIFEYRCRSCADEFEVFVRNSDTAVICPVCGSEGATKLFSTFGFSTGSAVMASSGSKSSCGGCSHHNCGGCHH